MNLNWKLQGQVTRPKVRFSMINRRYLRLQQVLESSSISNKQMVIDGVGALLTGGDGNFCPTEFDIEKFVQLTNSFGSSAPYVCDDASYKKRATELRRSENLAGESCIMDNSDVGQLSIALWTDEDNQFQALLIQATAAAENDMNNILDTMSIKSFSISTSCIAKPDPSTASTGTYKASNK